MNDTLVGKKIVAMRPMTNEEMEAEGWEKTRTPPILLVLDDGALVYPSRDEEGNGPGELFGKMADGRTVGWG